MEKGGMSRSLQPTAFAGFGRLLLFAVSAA
jgi:hypothetical protein